MRSGAGDTLIRFCARRVLCWLAFPLVCALGSTGSAVDRSALFVGFTATMAQSDFPPPCIIGFGSSPSRCGPPALSSRWPDAGPPNFRRDPFARDVVFDPGRATVPRITALLMLRSTMETASAPATSPFRGSIHTPRNRCVRFVAAVTAGSRNTRFQAARYALPGLDLHQLIAPASLAASSIRATCYLLPCASNSGSSGESR